ncbi:MAG: PAS domain-containing sensor histidine kinase [Deltaproteobacteria bacterium]|jgi:PAS domain S-box-containing protein
MSDNPLNQNCSDDKIFNALLNLSSDGVYILGEDGGFMEVNPAYCNLLGYSREELLTLSFSDAKTNEAIFRRIEASMASDAARFETSLCRKNGSMVDVEISTTHINAKDTCLFLSIVRDLTRCRMEEAEKARLREQLFESNQYLEEIVRERTRDLKEAMSLVKVASDAKSSFLASISHELRTPMNSIIGFSDVLAEEYVGPLNDKQREYVGDILDSAKHLLLLIDDILDVSRIESGRMTMEPDMVKLSDLLEDSLIMVREKVGKHSIAIRIEMEAQTSDIKIVADPQKLKQVLFNLISNAVKFTPNGGDIIIKTGFADHDSKTIQIIVEDSGIGIAPEYLEKIFENFFQVQGGILDKTRGAGLGLSLVRQLVEMHGGRVWAESSGIGNGSRFVVELPVSGH